jgi:YVTN family beta-propeller protein
MFVGNNWDGTATIVDAGTYRPITTINTIPDKDQRMAEIVTHPDKLAFYLAIQQSIGEGHDQYTDDMFSTRDGRLVAVSRPSFADVVGIDLATDAIVWRFPMEGYRSDHMAVSPDGERLLVSDSTANKVHELDIHTGRKLREFPSGDSPHESNYTRDGSRIFHASIGRVYTPVDRTELGAAYDTSKGERVFQIVRNSDFGIATRWDMGKELAEAGYPNMSSAVRPMAIAPDQRYAYLQVSFLHGFVEFDMQTERVTRVVPLPNLVPNTPKSQYILNSAHHGLAMNAAGTTLCAAGTMDGYAAMVDRQSGAATILPVGNTPYWATDGPGGNQCWMSVAADNKVAVLDYATKSVITYVPVGNHPQRVRAGVIQNNLIG